MTAANAPYRAFMSLAGEWRFSLDSGDAGIGEKWYARALEERAALPGTMDENGKGARNDKAETNHLSRKFTYRGPAWYQTDVDIPEQWSGKRIKLVMERTKHSTVWVDEALAGTADSLTAPHEYELGGLLAPGRHRITVRIDNADHPAIGDPHQISDHTQTNWNGILGRIELIATDKVWIEDAQVYPEPQADRLRVRIRVGNEVGSAVSGQLSLTFAELNGQTAEAISPVVLQAAVEPGMQVVEALCELKPSVRRWDEFDPGLYRVTVALTANSGHEAYRDAHAAEFGIREFAADGTQFKVNGRTILLRGKNDACVFPLTGYAPMDTESWLHVFETARSYGINHYRFHTWCPPEAAFAAADRAGVYLQPELPFWYPLLRPDEESYDPAIKTYLIQEGERILNAYGNHPSFVMFSLGNELLGSREELMDLVRHFRSVDPRHLYAEGSNNFYNTPDFAEGQDFWVTMRTGAGVYPVRGSFATANPPLGHIQVNEPSTAFEYGDSIAFAKAPVIGHETGQYQVYPDYNEIEKYTGVLEPRNLQVFRERLEQAGMLEQAGDFFRASGALAVACYREEIEAALRTPGLGGFQLLDLQDFPGQGTALVGILDAFMDSKGLIEPGEWRRFCSATVPLLIMEKYVWHTGEVFSAEIKLANYGPGPLPEAVPEWSLSDEDGHVLASGELPSLTVPQGQLTPLGAFKLELDPYAAPARLNMEIGLKNTDIRSRYPLWIYPQLPEQWSAEGVRIHRKLDDAAFAELSRGGRVLYLPNRHAVKRGVSGSFASDFWNYPMFRAIAEAERMPVAPGTLGLLCDPKHPALAEFPTEAHSNWQWWRLLTFSQAVIMDDAPGDYRPIVQIIDNIGRNHKLGVLFEAKVGSGKLLVCTMDLLELRNKPEAKQLMASLLGYMSSERFEPETELTEELLKQWFERSR